MPEAATNGEAHTVEAEGGAVEEAPLQTNGAEPAIAHEPDVEAVSPPATSE